MRFSSAFVLVATMFTLKNIAAVDPGNNALNMDVSDDFEHAIHKEYGPVVFDGLAKSGCSGWKCLKTVGKTSACLMKCVITGNPLCVVGCIPTSELCPCINCFPDVITNFLHKYDICTSELSAQLFSRVFLGLASDDEVKNANEAGYSISAFGA
ncbi:hypothetical protein PC9H_001747 [Pleurotus ostreatus]|uniref:Uncharacterized protein n=1 Tax=Pleurotus ostreatus TaxID=5322 RepID=A0A8H7DXS3_PLEOS|nr:uncharacterized protein PC9H_001747 [Pleurotus ostreatus]KAF7441397.1 hypothetical protein PC9H_001747 [Pleurotus ostreatus]